MSTRSDVGVYFRAYDQASGPMRSLGLTTQNLTRQLLGLAGVGGGLYGLTRAFDSVTKAAMAAEESENLFRVSMGKSAVAARAWSEQMSRALGLNEYEVRKNVSTFNVMFESMGIATDKAYEMAKGLTQLSYDMASFYNLRPEEAFQKLQAGITGEVEPLKRLGIVVNETVIKNKALNEGWIRQGETLSESGKVITRYAAILDQTQKAQGDLARTSESATNVQRRMQAQFEQAKITIGQALLPARTELTSWAATFLSDNASTIKRWASDWVEGADIVRGAIRRATEPTVQQLFESFGPSSQEELQRAYETEMGGKFGYYTTVAPGAMGGGAAIRQFIPPANEVYARRLMESRMRALSKAYGMEPSAAMDTLKAKLGLIGASGTEFLEGPSAIAPGETTTGGFSLTQKTVDVARIYERMYREIDSKTAESFAARQRLLDEELQENARVVQDQAALWQWYSDQRAKLGIEQGKATGGLFGGFAAGVAEMNRELLTTGELGANLATTLRDGVVGSISDAIFEARDLGDALREVGRSMARMAMQWALNQTVTGGLNMAFGVAHSGGVVGQTAFPTRMLPAGLFAGAPRLHGGLAPDEFPAILQRGERVTPRGGSGAPTVVVNVTNQGAPQRARVTGQQFDAALNRMIVGVLLEDADQGGPVSQRYLTRG